MSGTCFVELMYLLHLPTGFVVSHRPPLGLNFHEPSPTSTSLSQLEIMSEGSNKVQDWGGRRSKPHEKSGGGVLD